jgi:hypothetical protein
MSLVFSSTFNFSVQVFQICKPAISYCFLLHQFRQSTTFYPCRLKFTLEVPFTAYLTWLSSLSSLSSIDQGEGVFRLRNVNILGFYYTAQGQEKLHQQPRHTTPPLRKHQNTKTN